AEVSPYLRAGGRFDVQVSSVGDARSLRGGTLYMTPLGADFVSDPVATAQGTVLMSESMGRTQSENSARMPGAGVIEAALPKPQFADGSHLLLREPDVTMASRIADAINRELGEGMATVDDPGSITLKVKGEKTDHATLLARINDLRVQPVRNARLIIDGRTGSVVSGGDITVGEASISQGGVTLSIGPKDTVTTPAVPGQVRATSGTPVAKIAEALHAARTPPAQVAAIF